MDKFDSFSLEQLRALEKFVDCEKISFLLSSLNSNYSVEQIDIIGRAIIDGVDVSDLLNPLFSPESLSVLIEAKKLRIDVSDLLNVYISYKSLMILCEAKMKGVNVKGLDNINVDVSLLKQIINVKICEPKKDLSFIRDLSVDDCKQLVEDYKMLANYGIDCNFQKYRDKVYLERKKILTEFNFVRSRQNK